MTAALPSTAPEDLASPLPGTPVGSPVNIESRPAGVPPDSAAADLLATDLDGLRRRSATASDSDVDRALTRSKRDLGDLASLLSPAAGRRLEEMAAAAHRVTVQRFGRTVRLFAPLYLSNECVSTCTYCGFSAGNEIARRTLSPAEVRDEAAALVARGFRHVLLVAGEHARIISKDHLVRCVAAISDIVPEISLETQVWDASTYARLVEAGCDGLVVYQETYDRDTYGRVHLKGKKRNYDWRIAAPDRGAAGGMRRLGIGALLGLQPDWRAEALAVGAHAHALIRRHWRCEVSVALPRLRPAAGGYHPEAPVDDSALVQILCALRLVMPDVGVTMSTREPAELRDSLLRLGVTQMSAGSHTEPGGYASPSEAEPQFAISDTRSPTDVAAALRAAGYDPVWKDWQRS